MTTQSAKSCATRLTSLSKCAGCAAKLDPMLLREALAGSPQIAHPKVLVGTATFDDAGVYLMSDTLAMITTTDFFTPIVDDPAMFGAIAATNAMSDVYAMGGEVITALNIMSFPKTLPLSIMQQILQGAQNKVQEADGVIIGGHTIATETLMFGLAVTGTIDPADLTANNQAKPGDILILTKALGTGIITTAIKIDELSQNDGKEAYDSMMQLNAQGARLMRKYKVKSATDITGFSLLGHAAQMAKASGVTFELMAHDVPLMQHVRELAAREIVTGAGETNRKYTDPMTHIAGCVEASLHEVLVDPQTSGGLLIAVSADKAETMLRDLHSAGYQRSTIIGRVTAPQERSLLLRY